MKRVLSGFLAMAISLPALSQTQLSDVTSLDNIIYVQSASGIPAAVTALCTAPLSGGTIILPTLTNGSGDPVPYTLSSNLSLCSNLNIIGAGRGDTASECPTLINTSIGNGADAITIAAPGRHVHISDLCISYAGTGTPNAALRLVGAQYVTIERVTIFGSSDLQVGLEVNPATTCSSTCASAIYNHFRDIAMYSLAADGVGCLLYEPSSTDTHVINNNYFDNVNCIGGTGGAGLQVTGGDTLDINENIFHGGQFTAASGTGVLVGNQSARDLTMIAADIEGSATGLHLASQNDGFSCYSCNISSNTTNTTLVAGSTRTFITGNIGGAPQQFSLDNQGNMLVNSVAFSASVPTSTSVGGSGSAQALPSNPAGYLLVKIGSTTYEVPYYQ
jgi:hypothetical protein